MKRILIASILIFACALLLQDVKASSDIIAISVNDQILKINDSTMPEFKNGTVYVPYDIFSSYLSLRTAYNGKTQTLVVYNWDYTLTFDLSKNLLFDENMLTYNFPAYYKNSTVYVPINIICDKFSFYSSYLSLEIPVVRINHKKPALSDSAFKSIAYSIVNAELDAYNNSKSTGNKPEPSPDTTLDAPNLTKEQKPIMVYLTFDAPISDSVDNILDFLENNQILGVFFISYDSVIKYPDVIRRMISQNHTLGLLVSSDNIIHDAQKTNDEIMRSCGYTSKLLRVNGNISPAILDEIIKNGYRLWGYSVNAKDSVLSVSSSYNRVINSLKKTNDTICIRFTISSRTKLVLQKIINYLNNKKIAVDKIYVSDTPINSYNEIR